MNDKLHIVFTWEEEFVEHEMDERFIQIEKILAYEQVTKLIKELDVRKAMGPDEVAG